MLSDSIDALRAATAHRDGHGLLFCCLLFCCWATYTLRALIGCLKERERERETEIEREREREREVY
jgi:hypothetical protein